MDPPPSRKQIIHQRSFDKNCKTTYVTMKRLADSEAGKPSDIHSRSGDSGLLGRIVEAAMGSTSDRIEDAIRLLNGGRDAVSGPESKATDEAYLSLRQLSVEIGISPSTLWRYQIPGHEMGGHPRYKRSEVEAYLKSEAFKRRAASLRADRRNPCLANNINN